MSEVTVTINRRTYRISCDDGQENQLRDLAGEVDARIKELVDTMGQIGDERLLVMASLILADEGKEAIDEIGRRDADDRRHDIMAASEATLAAGINSMAARIESLAEALERA